MQNTSFHTAKTTDFRISLWQKTQIGQNSLRQNCLSPSISKKYCGVEWTTCGSCQSTHSVCSTAGPTKKAARRRLLKQGSKPGLRMTLGLGAGGQLFLEFGLFFHNLSVAADAVGVLEFFLGVHNIVQALFALLAGEVIVAT